MCKFSAILLIYSFSLQHNTLYKRNGVTEEAQWYETIIDIKAHEHFSIGLEAQFSGVRDTYIAVDDIEFQSCSLSKYFLSTFIQLNAILRIKAFEKQEMLLQEHFSLKQCN